MASTRTIDGNEMVSCEAVVSIVDDDDTVRSSIEDLLRSLGYMVRTFVSAKEFLESSLLHQTWCLISDVRMPGICGLDLQAILHAKGHDIPVIFITAHPDEHVRERAIQAGAVSFLSKPFSAADLMLCLDRAFKKH